MNDVGLERGRFDSAEQREAAKKVAAEKIGDVNWTEVYREGGLVAGVRFRPGETVFEFDNLHDTYRFEYYISLHRFFGCFEMTAILTSVEAFRKEDSETKA